MSVDEERSLADVADVSDEKDVSVGQSDMSVGDVLAGARAQRRAVKIRPNLHLLADMERLVDEIESSDEEADVDGLIDEYETVKADFVTYQWWVVEQRTHERRRQVRREAAKALGIELSDDGEDVKADDADRSGASAVEAHVLADHVVDPVVNADQVRALYDSSPGEFNRLEGAIVKAMRVFDEDKEQGVLRDFSSRRSGRNVRS